MNQSKQLQVAFASLAASVHQDGATARIVDALSDGSLTIETVDRALADAKHESQQWQRRQLVRLLLYYLQYAAKDGAVSREERDDLRFLAMVFRIRPGEVRKYGGELAREILDREMRRMLNDELVDNSELEYQTELQAVLGLGYDEFLEMTRDAFDDVVDQWIARMAADDVITAGERADFECRLQRLSTVYPLTHRQRRELGRTT